MRSMTVTSRRDMMVLYPSLAINPDGVLNVSYYSSTDQTLLHARREKSGWKSEVVDSDGDVGRFSSLAISTSRNAHVVYYDATGNKTKHAFNPCR